MLSHAREHLVACPVRRVLRLFPGLGKAQIDILLCDAERPLRIRLSAGKSQMGDSITDTSQIVHFERAFGQRNGPVRGDQNRLDRKSHV